MAETTRDEHRSQAEALVAEADRLVAMMMTRGTIHSAPMVSALTALAGLHLDLAGPEHEYALASEVAPLWVPEHKGCYRRAGGWSLIHFDEPSPGREEPGWYLFGPGTSPNGYWTTTTLAGAQATANRTIEVYQANWGTQ